MQNAATKFTGKVVQKLSGQTVEGLQKTGNVVLDTISSTLGVSKTIIKRGIVGNCLIFKNLSLYASHHEALKFGYIGFNTSKHKGFVEILIIFQCMIFYILDFSFHLIIYYLLAIKLSDRPNFGWAFEFLF